MGGQFRENYKRLANKLPPLSTPTAMDNKDLVRVEDLSVLAVAGSGLYRVTNLTSGTQAVAPGSGEAVFDLVVIRVSGDYDVVLPQSPITGKRYEIKDGAGDGCLSGTTKRILASGTNTIEGIFTEFPLSNCYQSWSLIYAGEDLWRLV